MSVTDLATRFVADHAEDISTSSRRSFDGAGAFIRRRRLRGGLQEREDAGERVAPVLALPAVALVVVPVDLVDLALDLEGLDHPLGHERHDPLVLAPVEDQQRRLDPLGAVDRRSAPVDLGSRFGSSGEPIILWRSRRPSRSPWR